MGFIGDVIEFIVKFPFIVIGWVIIGMLAGELARRFTNSPDKNGFADFALGIVGAFVGGLVAGLLGVNGPMGWSCTGRIQPLNRNCRRSHRYIHLACRDRSRQQSA